MSIDVRDVHIAAGKILQFMEEQKLPRDTAIAALHSAAETLQQTSYADQRLLMLAHYFRPHHE